MKLRGQVTSIALIVLAVGVALYAFLVDADKVSDVERAKREGNVFPAFRREALTRIELARGAERIVLEHSVGPEAGDIDWNMVEPRREEAEVGQIYQLVTQIELATRLRKVDDDAPGLSHPRLTGLIAMGAVTYRFALGDAAPTPEGAAYFRLEGEGAFVVKKDFVVELLKGADAYRIRTIVPYVSSSIARLEIKRGGAAPSELVLERTNDIDFQLPALGLRASREALVKVWQAFGEMRAEAFLADDEALLRVAPPALTITMTPSTTKRGPGLILVGGPCPGYPEDVVIVRKAPLPVLSACAPKGILQGLEVLAAALVDPRAFSSNADEIAELRLESLAPGAGARLELARSGNGWHERSPVERNLAGEEADAASNLVRALTSIKGRDARKTAPVEALTPRARATLAKVDARGPEIVEVVASGGDTFIHRLADDALLRASPELLRLLEPRDVALRGRALWPSVVRVEGRPIAALSTTCAAVPEELTHDDRGWTMRAPGGFDADAPAAFDVANELLRAKAEAWMADADDGSFGLARGCAAAVTLSDEAGTQVLRLLFGGEAPAGFAGLEAGGVYARVDGAPQVFLVSRTVRDMARLLMIDRRGFGIDVARVAKVTLARATGIATLTPEKGHLPKLEAELASLRADEVVHVGPARKDEGFDKPILDVRVVYAGDAGPREFRFVVGAKYGAKMLYARRDGVDATFAIESATLAPLIGAP